MGLKLTKKNLSRIILQEIRKLTELELGDEEPIQSSEEVTDPQRDQELEDGKRFSDEDIEEIWKAFEEKGFFEGFSGHSF
jgi:hypothetical protein